MPGAAGKARRVRQFSRGGWVVGDKGGRDPGENEMTADGLAALVWAVGLQRREVREDTEDAEEQRSVTEEVVRDAVSDQEDK